mgnify:CR=1 FL=1
MVGSSAPKGGEEPGPKTTQYGRNKASFKPKVLGILIHSGPARENNKTTHTHKTKDLKNKRTSKKSITNTQTRIKAKSTQDHIYRRDCDKAQRWERARAVLTDAETRELILFHASFTRNFMRPSGSLWGRGLRGHVVLFVVVLGMLMLLWGLVLFMRGSGLSDSIGVTLVFEV